MEESGQDNSPALPLENDHNVYILGAGFSAEGGLPVVSDFLNRMRDSHPWLVQQGRKEEASAIQSVLNFRRKATSATYWTKIDLENIEELFSLASIKSKPDTSGLVSSIRLAIAATIDYTWSTFPQKTIPLIFQADGRRGADARNIFPSVPSWFTKQSNYADGVYDVPLYAYFAGRLLGLFWKGDIVGQNTFITFNYDTLLEDALGIMKIPFGYGFEPDTVQFDETATASQKVQAINILKLHGSVNIESPFLPINTLYKPKVFGSYQQVPKHHAGPDLLPPTWNKRVTTHLQDVWSFAVEQLKTATRIIVVGFSMPATDVHFKYLLGAGLKENISLRQIVFINSDSETVKKRALDIFRGEHVAGKKMTFEDFTFRKYLARMDLTDCIGRPANRATLWHAG